MMGFCGNIKILLGSAVAQYELNCFVYLSSICYNRMIFVNIQCGLHMKSFEPTFRRTVT